MKFIAHDNVNVNLTGQRYTIDFIDTGAASIVRIAVLDHVENCFVFVQPHVMIRDGHRLERHGLGVFEKRIGPPDVFQPVDF